MNRYHCVLISKGGYCGVIVFGLFGVFGGSFCLVGWCEEWREAEQLVKAKNKLASSGARAISNRITIANSNAKQVKHVTSWIFTLVRGIASCYRSNCKNAVIMGHRACSMAVQFSQCKRAKRMTLGTRRKLHIQYLNAEPLSAKQKNWWFHGSDSRSCLLRMLAIAL
jgi:hypothetical protein